jgi:pimeloyl-ACP methyl ester carboxylesterase
MSSPAPSDFKIRTEFVDAGRIRFEVHACGDPASQDLALLLHGFPEHAISWRHQLPLLARLGYRVWAPNQRGYGRSVRPPLVRDYALDQLVADVGELIDASGARRVLLVGHDWGGAVAWAAALSHVRTIDRLVVMNLPHPRKFTEALRVSWRQRMRSWYVLLFQIPWLPEWLFRRNRAQLVADAFRNSSRNPRAFPEDILEIYRENALQPGALTGMLNWYRAAVRMKRATRERLLGQGVLDTPTLMIWGEHDIALGKELTYGTEALVRDFTIRYLPTSHWVQQEAPNEVNAILEAWLTGQPVPDFAQAPLLAATAAPALTSSSAPASTSTSTSTSSSGEPRS